MKMTDLKVILLFPNLRWNTYESRTMWEIHPYNICMLASMIENEYEVRVLDANMEDLSPEDFSKRLSDFKPDIVGISVLTGEYIECGFIAAKIAKQINPNVKTVIGGVHATTESSSVISNKYVDYCVVGEGEYVFKELCDFINGTGEFPKRGVARKDNGEIIMPERADFIFDLDKLPYPAYHKVDFLKYANKIQRETADAPRELPFGRIITSRGCPYNCCFCQVGSIFGKKPRLRSVKNIIGEIDILVKEYGIKSLLFDDDNLIYDKERAKELFQAMIDKKYNLKWNAGALALYKLDEEIIRLMEESGCVYVNVAVESGSQRVLSEIIHKPLELKKGIEMLKKLKKTKVRICANFVFGFPGETWEEIRETIKLAEDIDVDYVKLFIATPLPNTELYRVAKEGGYLKEGYDPNKHLWTDGWINTEEFTAEDLKYLRAYEWERINFTNPEKRQRIAEMMKVTPERLKQIRRETLNRAHKNN